MADDWQALIARAREQLHALLGGGGTSNRKGAGRGSNGGGNGRGGDGPPPANIFQNRGRKRRLQFVLFGVLAVMLVYEVATFYVPPNMRGVQQVYFGSGAGIREGTYGPGLWFIIPGFERLHLFPADLQVINFSDTASEMSKELRFAPAVKIQTSDGYNVTIDVSVLYHITNPYRVIVEAGPGRTFEDRLVVPRADRVLRRTLGELHSEEFYQGPQRIAKAKTAEEQLAAELKDYGIAVDGVLVRRYTYDERYQALIEGRKIKDQTIFLRQAEAKAAIEQRKRDTIIAEGKANVEVELARGDAEVQKLDSQADLYRRQQEAKGQLLIELAEAKGTQLQNDAMQSAGSENLVGLKMAEVLKGIDSLVLSSSGKDAVNPLDLAEMLRKFEVK